MWRYPRWFLSFRSFYQNLTLSTHSPMPVTCPAKLISLEIIIQIIWSEVQGLILMRWVGWDRVPLVRQQLVGPSYQPRIVDEMKHSARWELAGETEVFWEHSVHQNSHMTPPGIEPWTTRHYNPGDRRTACLQNFRGCVKSWVGSLTKGKACVCSPRAPISCWKQNPVKFLMMT
jgi:hypothetical protein